MNIISLIIGGGISLGLSLSWNVFESVSKLWIFFALWLALYVLVLVSLFVVLYLISLCLTKKPPKKPNKFCYLCVKMVVDFLCRGARIKVHIRGGELIEKNQRYLLVSNHRSKFDPMLQLHKFFRCRPVMISKPENMKIPLAGAFLNKAGFLPIDRNNDREALKTIIKAIHFIEDENVSIGMCPEGTRNRTSRDLLPLKAGAFKIATKAQAPIAVMTFEGTEKIAKNFPLKRTHVYIDVLKVIQPSEYAGKSTQELSDEIAKMMQDNINSYTDAERVSHSAKGAISE